ncbi:MAG: phosphonate ABC transporter ATP-binding protein [Guyparkeria sp.]|uniref:phosphonate ABC transporter ATP-binding protein n=1 Tax=Guyparkeria sp. TaxID=2035736 RepID=UPI003978F14E
MSASPILEARGIQKRFARHPVLQGVDLSVESGAVTILLGANGSGKSTLIRCLTGLERIDAGEVWLDGGRIDRLRGAARRRARRRIALVFQHFNLIDNVSVFQNVLNGAMGRAPLGMLGVLSPLASTELRDKAMDCLARVGLADRAAHPARTLSGGQQQRVAIARALMQQADVLIADEPVASLDPQAGRGVMDLLVAVAREEGMTVLASLHQLALAEEYGDRIVGLKAGQVDFDTGAEPVARDRMEALYVEGVDAPAGEEAA